MKSFVISLLTALMVSACVPSSAQEASSLSDGSGTSAAHEAVYRSIYWSDADSGRLGSLKFRLANKDAPETRSMKQRGGAKCEAERKLGYEAKAYMVAFTKNKTIRIARDYGEDRYGRLVVDLEADGLDVGTAGVEAGHLRDWLHIKGRAQSPKPDWCAGVPD